MSSSSSSELNTFRFFDLPVELRLIVYEYLPNEATLYDFKDAHANGEAHLTLKIVHVPTTVLYTCREVHMEAIKIVKKKQALAASIPARVVVTGWDGGTVNDLSRLHTKIPTASHVAREPDCCVPDLSLPRNKRLSSAFERLAQSLPKIEFALAFPVTFSDASEMMWELCLHSPFRLTFCILPGSISKGEFDALQLEYEKKATVKWEELTN